MPKPRLTENQGLPKRWQISHGAYYYRVPPGHEKYWDHKKRFYLGRTFEEALSKFESVASREDLSVDVDGGSLLEEADIVNAAYSFVKSGVYFLLSEGRVIYVGRSSCIPSRIAEHLKRLGATFDGVYWIECKGLEQERLEQLYIARLMPEMNTLLGGVARSE